MNIFSYIDKYGSLTFEEEPFNEIDNIIFSAISYIDFEKYVSKNSSNKKTIHSVGNQYFKEHSKKEKNIIATKNALKVLLNIKDTNRYKNLLLYNYSYIGDKSQQFSAITIEINKKLVYISYEGTDSLISGWKEDFMMGYQFPVQSQRRAINYVNKNFLFSNKKIILGGHSKGGNLAQVAGMYSNYFIQKRIINIYNNDGPGLKQKEFSSKYYKKIENKLIHIIPNYSLFGLLLRNNKKYIVIKSAKKDIFAHDFITWIVEKKEFKRDKLSTFSTAVEKSGNEWLNKYNEEQIQKFVKTLFGIIQELNIVYLTDIYDNKKLIFELIMKSKDIEEDTKTMLKDFIYNIFKHFKDLKANEIQNFFKIKK